MISFDTTNSVPVLAAASYELDGSARGGTWNVRQIGTSAFSDVNTYDRVGIAISSVNPTGGTWTYSLDGGNQWSTMASPSAGDRILLRPQDLIRFVPTTPGTQTVPASLVCYGWDQFPPLVTAGVRANVNPTVLSTASVQIDLSLTNSSPYWDSEQRPLDLPDVPANTPDPGWTRLDNLVRGAFYDDDFNPNDPRGIAVTAVAGAGWEWGVDANQNGQPDVFSIPADTIASAAVLLSAADTDNVVLRYRPSLSDGGQTRSLTIRAWDQTSNSVDASNPVATGAFSLGTTAAGLATISIDVVAIVVPNNLPEVLQPANFVAIAGQPWEILVTASDLDNEPDLALEFATAATGVSIGAGRPLRLDSGTYYRTFPVSGTAAGAGTVTFSLRAHDGTATSYLSRTMTVTVVAAGNTALTAAVTIAPSSATNPVYGAIAPGSTANYQVISSSFGDLFTDRARAVWWLGGYRDLPTLPADTMRQGVLLSSTLDRPFSLTSIPRQAAPFAITLPANSWSLVGVPPLVVDAVPTVEQSHPWDVFHLEDLDGVTQSSSVVRNVLEITYQGTTATTPFQLTGSSYVRAGTLASGTAYWIPNFSSTAYRLVRGFASDANRFGVILSIPVNAPLAAAAASSAASQRSGPPPPPGGAAPAAEGGGGGCGGGLAGLLIASLALLGLRPRRRA